MPKALSNNIIGTLVTKVKNMLGDYYTKSEADDKFALKSVINVLTSTYATKKEMNSNLQTKQDTLVGAGDNQNIKTINGTSILGAGNITTPTTSVVQATGSSTTAVMSQDATTKALSEVSNSIPTKTSALTNDSSFVTSTTLDTQLATKQNNLVSGTSIKTINGTSILGSGNITTPTTSVVQATGTSTTSVMSQKAVSDSLNEKQATLVSGSNIKTIGGESILGSGDIAALRTRQWWQAQLSGDDQLELTYNTYSRILLGASNSDMPLNSLPICVGFIQISRNTATSIAGTYECHFMSDVEGGTSLYTFEVTIPTSNGTNYSYMAPILAILSSNNSNILSAYPNIALSIKPKSTNNSGAKLIRYSFKLLSS